MRVIEQGVLGEGLVGLKLNLVHNALQSTPPKRRFLNSYQKLSPRWGKKTSMSPARHLGFHAEIQLLGRAFGNKIYRFKTSFPYWRVS